MQVIEGNKLKDIIVVGDRVLIKPKSNTGQTKTGLFLPPGVKEKEKVQTGYIVKAGPGYPIPYVNESNEPWIPSEEKTKYIPLQCQEGDLAVFMQSAAVEINYNDEKYLIVPHSSIMMLVRDEDLLQ